MLWYSRDSESCYLNCYKMAYLLQAMLLIGPEWATVFTFSLVFRSVYLVTLPAMTLWMRFGSSHFRA